MNYHYCEACIKNGEWQRADQKDSIFSNDGRRELMSLCYSHSVELFKMGQRVFMLKYKSEEKMKIDQLKSKEDRLRNYFVFNSFK